MRLVDVEVRGHVRHEAQCLCLCSHYLLKHKTCSGTLLLHPLLWGSNSRQMVESTLTLSVTSDQDEVHNLQRTSEWWT